MKFFTFFSLIFLSIQGFAQLGPEATECISADGQVKISSFQVEFQNRAHNYRFTSPIKKLPLAAYSAESREDSKQVEVIRPGYLTIGKRNSVKILEQKCYRGKTDFKTFGRDYSYSIRYSTYMLIKDYVGNTIVGVKKYTCRISGDTHYFDPENVEPVTCFK